MEHHVLEIAIETMERGPIKHSHLHRFLVVQVLAPDGIADNNCSPSFVFLQLSFKLIEAHHCTSHVRHYLVLFASLFVWVCRSFKSGCVLLSYISFKMLTKFENDFGVATETCNIDRCVSHGSDLLNCTLIEQKLDHHSVSLICGPMKWSHAQFRRFEIHIGIVKN